MMPNAQVCISSIFKESYTQLNYIYINKCTDVIGLLSGMKPIEEKIIAKDTPKERTSNIREIEIILLE
jgi:hypothetical protein